MRKNRIGFALAGLFVLALAFQLGCGRQQQEAQEQPAAEQPAAQTAQRAQQAPAQRPPAERAAAAPPAPAGRSVTFPAGTSLKVRTTTAISTKDHKTGDTFVASLETPLADGATVIAPKGSTVIGRVVDADEGGRVSGRARIAVQLTQLKTPDGREIALATNTIAREAPGTKKKDATKIGIGSGVGAAIGAIAGGGKGAAVGAAVGAGAGTGVVVATHGDPAVIGSESVLTFRLNEPVTTTVR